MRPRVYLFDIDDTLVDRGAAFRRWCARHHPDRDVAALAAADDRGRAPRTALARALALAEVDAFAARFPGELAACVEPDPAMIETLAVLRARGARIAVVSNGGATTQRTKVARAGLEVDAWFLSAECGVAKPDPGLLQIAMEWGRGPLRDLVVVGDDPVNDIAPAFALGLRTIYVRRDPSYPAHLPPPDRTIDDLAELRA